MASSSGLQNSFTLTWKIGNFSCCVKRNKGEFLESPQFFYCCSPYEKWTMRLYPKGMSSDDYLSIQLCRSVNFECTEVLCAEVINVDFVISILQKDGLTFGDQIHRAEFTTQSSESSIYDFLKKEEITSRESSILPEDTLTIQCILKRPVEQHFVAVKYQEEKLSFTWTIQRFSRIGPLQPETANQSYDIPIPCTKAPRFVLKFELVGVSTVESYLQVYCEKTHRTSMYDRQHYDYYVDYYNYDAQHRSRCSLNCKHFDACSISVTFFVSISDTNSQRRQLIECEHTFVSTKSLEKFCLPILVKRSDLIAGGNLVHDNLSLFFDLKISNGKYITEDDKHKTMTLHSPPQLCRNNTLGQALLEDKKFCDVTLKVGSEEYPVHKSVICTKSPIFYSMFTCDMKEKESGIVDIVDVPSDTLKHLLQYMYTDTLDDGVLDDTAIAHLYSAAHIYQVTSLVELCSTLLKSKITTGNVWDIASFAVTYQDTALIEASKHFISQQPNECLKSDRWHFLLEGGSLFLSKYLTGQTQIESSEGNKLVET